MALTAEDRLVVRLAKDAARRKYVGKMAAIERAERGLRRLTHEPRSKAPDAPMMVGVPLSPAERDTLAWIMEGLTTAAMAERAGCTENTAKARRASLYVKLGASREGPVVAAAFRMGLVE